MPTNIVQKPSRPIIFLLFVGTLFSAWMAIEIVDPAPMDIDGATVASP